MSLFNSMKDAYENPESRRANSLFGAVGDTINNVSNSLLSNNTQQNTAGQLDNRMQSMFSNVPIYAPQTGMEEYVRNNKITNPNTMQDVSIDQYFDPSTLRNDIYSGIEANVNQSKEKAMNNLKETMANAGLFRSGLTLENQQDVERDAMDSLAKGWGQTAAQVANIQSDLAKSQAQMDYEVNKYNSDIQNAWAEKNYDYLVTARAQDQQAVNQARQFNVDVQNAYDEMAFKWANSMLDQEIREYAANLDYLAKEGNTIAQFGTEEANEEWSNLRPAIHDTIANSMGADVPERSIPDTSPTLEQPSYSQPTNTYNDNYPIGNDAGLIDTDENPIYYKSYSNNR